MTPEYVFNNSIAAKVTAQQSTNVEGSRAHCQRDTMRSVMLLLRSLDRGGAEKQAVTLACELKQRGWPVSVACFYSGGAFASDLAVASVPLFEIGKHGRWDIVRFLRRFYRLLSSESPRIVYAYLPPENLLILFMRILLPDISVIWGVSSSYIDLRHYKLLDRLLYWMERRLARLADLVISNSRCGAAIWIGEGFPKHTMRIIANGIDTERFRYDNQGRSRLRAEWGVPAEARLVGLVGRLDPMKDHSTFLQAAALLTSTDKSWRFVCVGSGPENYTQRLILESQELNLTNYLIWAGACDDMAAVYSALDMVCSSSYGEGLPNVVPEAMSCGRPSVVTDVGDCALVVGDTGVVVAPRDAHALAHGIEKLQRRLECEGDTLREAARARIKQKFGVERLADETIEAFDEILSMRRQVRLP